MSKPKVYFDMNSIVGFITVGVGAIVIPKNHTSELVSNKGHVFTSDVLRVTENNGMVSFETHNTKYIGCKENHKCVESED